MYNIKKGRNSIFIYISPKIREILSTKINQEYEDSDNVSYDDEVSYGDKGISPVDKIMKLLKRKRNYNELNKYQECELFFSEIVSEIKIIIGESRLSDLHNLKSLSEEQLDELKSILGNIPFSCHLQNIERNKSDTYWKLTCNERIFSTETSENSDLFGTLVSFSKEKYY